jgi:hypothetical protein
MSAAIGMNWAANLLVSATFLSPAHLTGRPGFFLLFFVIGVGAAFFISHVVVETKGLALSQVQQQIREACARK